jgi:hypothetical protein
MEVHILNLKSKLTTPHIFLELIPKNINTNAFSIHVVHLWFANTYIQFMFLPICSCNILHIIYDKNK